MTKRNKTHIPFWDNVDRYLKTETTDSITLALLEADKTCTVIAKQKYSNFKTEKEQLDAFTKDLKRPETFLQLKEYVDKIRYEPGFILPDPYQGMEYIQRYRELLQESLYGEISEEEYSVSKLLLRRIHSFYLLRKQNIKKAVLWLLVIVAVMLFISDTQVGANVFTFIIEQLHFILKMIVIGVAVIALVGFILIFFITGLEKRTLSRKRR
ncbi:MAG: hypothetical protein WC045_03395 [Patescibacteria group bacterium]